MSTNVCTVIGRLNDDPKITTMQDGKERVCFSVACERNYTDDQGKRPVDWFPVVIWGSANYVRKAHMKKGDKVCVSGRMENRRWTTNTGVQRDGWQLHCNHIEKLGRARSVKDEATDQAAEQMDFPEEDLPF